MNVIFDDDKNYHLSNVIFKDQISGERSQHHWFSGSVVNTQGYTFFLYF